MDEGQTQKHTKIVKRNRCRNPSFGLTTKARACKGANQEWSSGVTFHAPKNVGKCEGMNPHTPKWTPNLGVRVLMDSRIFRERLQGSQLIGLKISLHHWKFIIIYMPNMGSYYPFGYLKHKLWPKEGLGVKLPIWLMTTKSQESPQLFLCRWRVTYQWKALDEGYNFTLNLISIEGF
jgi:hypothetical protein